MLAEGFAPTSNVAQIDSRCFFPVARGIWLECSAHTTLECIDSPTLLGIDTEWLGMQAFSTLVLAYLRRQLEEAEQREKDRVRAMTEADAAAVKDALLELARPLQQADEEKPISGGGADPLTSACQAVGRAAGIEIKSSAGSAHRLKQARSRSGDCPGLRRSCPQGPAPRPVVERGQWPFAWISLG